MGDFQKASQSMTQAPTMHPAAGYRRGPQETKKAPETKGLLQKRVWVAFFASPPQVAAVGVEPTTRGL